MPSDINLELLAVVFCHRFFVVYDPHHSVISFLVKRLSLATNVHSIPLVPITVQVFLTRLSHQLSLSTYRNNILRTSEATSPNPTIIYCVTVNNTTPQLLQGCCLDTKYAPKSSMCTNLFGRRMTGICQKCALTYNIKSKTYSVS